MLIIIIYSTASILLLYCLLICKFTKGWKQNLIFEAEVVSPSASNISVIIPFRNEERNLPNLIAALKNQTATDFHIIFVDDHSTDASRTIVESDMNGFDHWTLLSASQHGKKKALKDGILYATSEIIVTTDADCIPNRNWITTINEFQHANKCDLIIGPIKMEEEISLFGQLQALEFTTLIAAGAGAAIANMPIMCNGANLAFTKAAWLLSANDLHEEELSGDDIFLLQSIKKRKGKISFLKSKGAIVSTKGMDTLGALLKQRQRWTSKSKLYKDFDTIYTAMIVLAITTLQVSLFVAAWINLEYLIVFVTLFLIKLTVDLQLLLEVKSFFGMKNIVLKACILSIVYPFYITTTAISGLLKQTKDW